MNFLKKQETQREAELANLGRLIIKNLKEGLESKSQSNDLPVLNYIPTNCNPSDFGEIFETEPADIDFNDLIRSRSKDLLLVNTFLSKKTQSTDGTVEILMLKDEPINEMDIENKHSLFIGTRRTTHLK